MAEESVLKIECAKLQAAIKGLEDELSQLSRTKDRLPAVTEAQKQRAISEAKNNFINKQRSDIETIKTKCAAMREKADVFLDTFPDLKSKEYAGKYEIKDLEARLSELYPVEMLSSYVCLQPLEFSSEGEAYRVYTRLERRVASLKQGSFASALFSGLTGLMNSVCKDDGMSGKIALGVVALIVLSFIVSPFVFLTIFTVVGFAVAVQGILIRQVLRNLYSVKAFLNESYDEDIFQKDKSDIMNSVNEFLEETQNDYIAEVQARQFEPTPGLLKDIENSAAKEQQKLEQTITVKQQLLAAKQQEAAIKLQELDAAVKTREEAAQRARKEMLETVDWKHEWLSQILLGVTAEHRVQGCHWLQGNTLYVAKDPDQLQTFWQLAIYQSMLHMHPDFAGQVVLDYKYMGSNLMQFSRVLSSIFTLCTDKEDIDKRVLRIKNDIRARTSNILKSCSSLVEFNTVMASYGGTGEAYVIVHLCGLQSISTDLKSFLRNGPKVGYFFKLYLTFEEFKELGKDFPFDEIPEYSEITNIATPRTAAQLRRLLEESA